MRTVFLACVLGFLGLVMCATLQRPRLVSGKQTSATIATYTIIKDDAVPGTKRTVDVRLSCKVSEATLISLAAKIKDSDPHLYQRTFIYYFLPNLEVGTGAWASTHFDPDLKVDILGLTIEQERALTRETGSERGQEIGRWLDGRQFVGNRITIYRENGRVFMVNKYFDGSHSKQELIERRSSKGRKFEEKKGSDFGDYFLIDRQGNLQFWDQEGYFYTAKNIR